MLRAIRGSIRLKLMVVVIAATFAALLIAAVILVIYDARRYTAASTNDLITQADLVGQASAAALAFDDARAARENLGFLALRPRITAGAIYTARGALFASYLRPGAADTTVPAAPGPEVSRVRGDQMELFRGIRDASGRVGTLYLRADYQLASRVTAYLAIVGAAMIASLLIAILISFWLQSLVTRPIVEIADVAHRVKAHRDLSLQARKTTEDEIGSLVDTFNEMITEIRQRTEALETANRTLEREMAVRQAAQSALLAADQKKDEFLATLAHELRNPLAPLRNALTILTLRPDDPAVTRNALALMDRQLRQMVRLVDDLLDVSRITTGKLALQCEWLDLRTLIQGALDASRPAIDERRIRLEVGLPDAPVTLWADSTRMSQVLLNLLNNAAKFTAEGGTVTLAASVAGDDVVIAVTDDGIGLTADQIPVIFDMFSQVDRSLERRNAGLGVGLSLALRLVELHGGTLTAESDGPGRGSRFTIRLPQQRHEGLQAVPGTGSADRAASGRRRVLLADDNQDFASSFAWLLRETGHDVRVAHDGEEALAAAQAFEPDIAFLDIGLPRLNGYDLARRLRALPWPRPPVLVAVTGWGQMHDKARALAAGFDRHLVKPVDLDQVRSIIDGAAARLEGEPRIGQDAPTA